MAAAIRTNSTGRIARVKRLREEAGKTSLFEIHVISPDGFTRGRRQAAEDKGAMTSSSVSCPYTMGLDTEPLQTKIRNLEMFAENVNAKVYHNGSIPDQLRGEPLDLVMLGGAFTRHIGRCLTGCLSARLSATK